MSASLWTQVAVVENGLFCQRLFLGRSHQLSFVSPPSLAKVSVNGVVDATIEGVNGVLISSITNGSGDDQVLSRFGAAEKKTPI